MDVRSILRHACRKPERAQAPKLNATLQHRPPARQCGFEKCCCSWDWKFEPKLLLDNAAARGMYRRDGVGTIRHLSTKVFWATAVGETRSGHGWSMYIRREPRRLGDEVSTRPQTATAAAMERSGVGQDDVEQRKAATHTISDPGQRNGQFLEALWSSVCAIRGTK